MPNILSKTGMVAQCFKTGVGLTFNQMNIKHECISNRHAVRCGWHS